MDFDQHSGSHTEVCPSCTDSRFSDETVYLEVPFPEKDRAKAAGARWDPRKIQWYAPPGTDLSPLETWIKQRIYLCAFKDKTTVAEHGARWDRVQQRWYITSDMDPSPFRSWLACEDSRGWSHIDTTVPVHSN